MIVTKENQRLYCRPWSYNAARVLSRLAEIINDNGGNVKPETPAVLVFAGPLDKIRETEERLERYKSQRTNAGVIKAIGPERIEKAIRAAEEDLQQLKSEPTPETRVTHTSYISFTLDGFYYYFQIDRNYFFPFYYLKTQTRNGGTEYSRDAALDETPKTWLYDCLIMSAANDADICECAHMLYNELQQAAPSEIIRDYEKKTVPNKYDGGWHYEKVMKPERIGKIDW